MEIGMLWFDNTKSRSMSEKIVLAADYYQKKYGQTPNVCEVHPGDLLCEEIKTSTHGITVRTSKTIMANHVWLGREEGAAS